MADGGGMQILSAAVITNNYYGIRVRGERISTRTLDSRGVSLCFVLSSYG